MNEEPENFLSRWSRRKRAVASERNSESFATPAEAGQVAAVSVPGADATAQVEAANAAQNAGDCEADAASGSGAAEPGPDLSKIDFDTLDFESDYTPFMDTNVSDEMRNKALRKLWVSNPVLANMDGLDDYCEDYTDAAVCLPKGLMKTAYRYGRGFLDDDEVAEWEALGRPEPAADDLEQDAAPDEEPAVAATESPGSDDARDVTSTAPDETIAVASAAETPAEST